MFDHFSKSDNKVCRAEGKSSLFSRRVIYLLMVVWVGFIFGTSCTVIRPEEFFALIQKYTFVDEAAMRQFRIFWGVVWFAVVKGWHFTEFAILLFLLAGVFRFWRGSNSTSSIVIAMLLCIAFAISDEWHQSFIPDRNGTLMDVLIDSLGVCTAGFYLLRRQQRQNKLASEIMPSNNSQKRTE